MPSNVAVGSRRSGKSQALNFGAIVLAPFPFTS